MLLQKVKNECPCLSMYDVERWRNPQRGLRHAVNVAAAASRPLGGVLSGPGLALESARPLHGGQHLLGVLGRHASLLLEHLFQSVTHTGWHFFSVTAQKEEK